MTNMTKDEIKALQIKAAEISDHFENKSSVYVRSEQEIFHLNRENHDDAFIASRIADKYWWIFGKIAILTILMMWQRNLRVGLQDFFRRVENKVV